MELYIYLFTLNVRDFTTLKIISIKIEDRGLITPLSFQFIKNKKSFYDCLNAIVTKTISPYFFEETGFIFNVFIPSFNVNASALNVFQLSFAAFRLGFKNLNLF